MDQLLAFEPAQAARVICLILEELGWGDAGLASSLGVSMFPRWMAAAFGNQHLLELTPGSEDSAAGRPPSLAMAPISSIPAARSSIPAANTANPTAWRRSRRTGS